MKIKTIGILGGGQLGQMMLPYAMQLGVKVHILTDSEDCPCEGWCDKLVVGSLMDYETVVNFGNTVDLITIEFEHVHAEALKELERRGKLVYPQPDIVACIQDKGSQYAFYQRKGLPCPDFALIEDRSDLKKLSPLFPAVQKSRAFGYDGKGVYKIRSEADIAQAIEGPSLLQKWVSIHKELSVLIARNASGQVAVYPVCEWIAHEQSHLLDYLIAPARVSKTVAENAQQLAIQVSEAFGHVGLMAVELFLTPEQTLLINECAPRPHNTGHHTIEASACGQFEMHLRAILDLPLGNPQLLQPAIMQNILGPDSESWESYTAKLYETLQDPDCFLHLYGKPAKPMRKMGHITLTGDAARISAKHASLRQKLEI